MTYSPGGVVEQVNPVIPDFATPLDPERAWMLGVHGPVCIPCRQQVWEPGTRTYTYADIWPHSPGLYGRYIVIDLDENNRHSRAEWAKRNGREPRSFGWGVCRHGFGLENLPRHDARGGRAGGGRVQRGHSHRRVRNLTSAVA